MIEYLYKEGEPACSKEPLKVRVNGIDRGEIRKVEGGYAYFPRSGPYSGKVCRTVSDVQRALRDELA